MAEQTQEIEMTADAEYNYQQIQTRDKAAFAANLNAAKRFYYSFRSDARGLMLMGDMLGFSSADKKSEQNANAESETEGAGVEGTVGLPNYLNKNVDIYHEMQSKGENAKILSWDNVIGKVTSTGVLQLNAMGLVDPDNPVVREKEQDNAKYSELEPTVDYKNVMFDASKCKHKELEDMGRSVLDYVRSHADFEDAMANATDYLVTSTDEMNMAPMYESNIGEYVPEAEKANQHVDDIALESAMAATPNMQVQKAMEFVNQIMANGAEAQAGDRAMEL